MSYPRGIVIHLAEKGISPSVVTLISVGNFLSGTANLVPGYALPPPGSLPIPALLTASPTDANGTKKGLYVRQTAAVVNSLEGLRNGATAGFPSSPSMRGATPMERARNDEILGLIEECLNLSNPLHLTGSKQKGHAERNEAAPN